MREELETDNRGAAVREPRTACFSIAVILTNRTKIKGSRTFPPGQGRPAHWPLTALLVTELGALSVILWPLLYNFNKFAFWDWGGYLVAHYLLQQGHTPVTGFGWQYGLLPLLLQEIGFHFARADPATFLALSFLCAIAFTVAIGSFGKHESGAAGQALILLSLPFTVALGSDLPHALEPVCLTIGLLLQAKGKRPQALALATAACFTKPVMAYLYGFILIVFLILDLQRRDRLSVKDLTRALLPAWCTGFGLILVLGLTFTWKALFTSLIPLSGAHVYRLLHYGWSGSAPELFYFPGVRAAYYIGTPVTFWVIATVYLSAAVSVASWRTWRRNFRAPRNYEIVLTCALLHIGFITLFYGSASSWIYYAYILVMGVATTECWNPTASRAIWVLCVLAAVSNYSQLKSSVIAWKTMERSPIISGLFASPNEISEWENVTSMSEDKKPALFTWDGAADLLFPWLSKPVAAFIVPGMASGNEIRQEVQQLDTTKTLIIPVIPELGNPIAKWPGPEFQAVLHRRTLVFKGLYFEVYERDGGQGMSELSRSPESGRE